MPTPPKTKKVDPFSAGQAEYNKKKPKDLEAKIKTQVLQNKLNSAKVKNNALKDKPFTEGVYDPTSVDAFTSGQVSLGEGYKHPTDSMIKVPPQLQHLVNPALKPIVKVLSVGESIGTGGMNEIEKALNRNKTFQAFNRNFPKFHIGPLKVGPSKDYIPNNTSFVDWIKGQKSAHDLLQTAGGFRALDKKHPVAGAAADMIVGSALDPTMYGHVKINKPLEESSKLTAIGRTVAEYADSPLGQAEKLQHVNDAKKAARIVLGPTHVFTQPELVRMREAAAVHVASNAKSLAEAAVKKEMAGKGTVQLRILDKPFLESQGLYKAGEKILKPAKILSDKIGLGEHLNPAWKTTDEIHKLERRNINVGQDIFNQRRQAMREFFAPLNKEEKILITKAREANVVSGVFSSRGTDLTPYIKEADKYYKDFYSIEGAAGLHSGTKYDPSYTYVYPKGDGLKGSYKTLSAADAAGKTVAIKIDDNIELRMAKHHSIMVQKGFINDLVSKYGVIPKSRRMKDLIPLSPLVKSGELVPIYEKTHPLMKGLAYVPPQVANFVKASDHIFNNPVLTSQLNKNLDKAMGLWKLQATALNPGHHINNAISDVVVNYMDGVVNPLRYEQSARVVSSHLRDGFKTKIGGVVVDGNKLWEMYTLSGLKTGYMSTEFGNTLGHNPIINTIKKGSEGREDFTRMAHFIDALKKEGAGAKTYADLAMPAEKAAERVIKYNHDFGDITNAEKKLKNIVPFHSWMRKNIPLMVESMFLKPGKISFQMRAANKAMQALGIDENTLNDVKQTIPSWAQEGIGAVIRKETPGNGGALFYTPRGLPFNDVLRTVSNPIGEVANSFGPLIKAPVELSQGTKIFNKAPTGSTASYLEDQFTLPHLIQALLSKPKPGTAEDAKRLALLRYLTGQGVYRLDEHTKQGVLTNKVVKTQKENAKLVKKKLGQ